MNAAVRAVVRTAISLGAEVYACYEGYQGMIDGGTGIGKLAWSDVGSILNMGGTAIGTFRSADFRKREGRVKATKNLLERDIDRLIVIGGNGSLTGLDTLAQEWSENIAQLVAEQQLSAEVAAAHPQLFFAGLVGSIDNDLVGTDNTIGADSALHRIVDAINSLTSTAASHQRSFVVEVMGRNCGYLALMSAIAGGCDYALIPEMPPESGWEKQMREALAKGRAAGRRHSLVVVAEGATDRNQNPISSEYVCEILKHDTDEDVRVTKLGHVQRGGTPSAYDRWASTWLGYEAVMSVLTQKPGSTGKVIGFHNNKVSYFPLAEAVKQTNSMPELIATGRYDEAVKLRGSSFKEMADIFTELVNPPDAKIAANAKRVAVLHAGGLAPGMNVAAKTAIRLGISRGFTMLGVEDGFVGLAEGRISEFAWEEVEDWFAGGASLGLRRATPKVEDFYAINHALDANRVDALLIIGGWDAYEGARLMNEEKSRYPAFRIPIVCVPASIDNNLPGSTISIGADTALNVIAEAIDRIKMSGHAATRAFVVETMGGYCGYLAAMGGLSGGAERIYLHEEGITLADLERDVRLINEMFSSGRKLFLAVRNEAANPLYSVDFIARLLEEEGGDLFDVRQAILGHIQQGGDPTPYDRLLATRLAASALQVCADQFKNKEAEAAYIGIRGEGVVRTPMSRLAEEFDLNFKRPKRQWWLQLLPVISAVSGHQPARR
ncbi:MAG: 6-phosphofructokinase [Propionibacteriaceae bacterium]|nr:6-phosphofructokinase [Propionibacteriaceae bacterium]